MSYLISSTGRAVAFTLCFWTVLYQNYSNYEQFPSQTKFCRKERHKRNRHEIVGICSDCVLSALCSEVLCQM